MADNVIGFAGSDKYELILYLSRILFHLRKTVLLVDSSESEALYQCIPVPDTLREDSGYINYRGIDFIQGQFYHMDMAKRYDLVLMDLGFQIQDAMLSGCTKLFCVTDLQLQNIRRIEKIISLADINKYLIIKDVFHCKIKPDDIAKQFGQAFDRKKIYILYQDALDLKYKMQSQYNCIFSFSKLSASVKDFLKDTIRQIDDNLEAKEINDAYRKAERGK